MRIFWFAVISIFILNMPAFCDIIYFEDGGEVEGIVKEDTGDYVVIDMGFGTMSVRSEEIDYIKKGTPRQIEELKRKKLYYDIERGGWAPPGYDDIRIIYGKAREDRSALEKLRKKYQGIKTEISENERDISRLLAELDKKGRELKALDSDKEIKKYNSVVADMNGLNSQLNSKNNRAKALYEEESRLDKDLSEAAAGYRGDFQIFKDALSGYDPDDPSMTTDEAHFFEIMAGKLSEMDGDFERGTAQYTPEGGHVIVDAVIDRRVSARLMVDTGASLVLISRDVAFKLGVNPEDINQEIEIIIADGSSVPVKPIMLDSVKVGDSEVKNVQAAILDDDTVGGVDGLLGMTFLNNFLIKVDSSVNKLILERAF